jgi:hypothetical protein
MEYIRLGSTGMKVSRICLGCMGFGDSTRWIHKWVLNEENSRPIIKKGLMLVDKMSSGVILEFLLKETKHTRGRTNDKRLQGFLYVDVRVDR